MYHHKTKDGRIIPIEQMEEAHLLNTIKMIQRSIEPYNREWERRHRKFKLRDLFKKPKKTEENDILHEISMLEAEF